MVRTVSIWSVLLIVFATEPAVAGPGELLKQAVEENNTAQEPTKEEIHALVSKADALVEQQAFAKAIALYERAYRLAPMEQSNYVRLLVAKRAAGSMTAQEREALELIREEASVKIDQIFRLVRLDVLQARRALRAADAALAMAKIEHAESALDGLPDPVDASPYRRQLIELRKAAVRRAGRRARQAGGSGQTSTRQRATRATPASSAPGDERVLTLIDGAQEEGPSPTGRIIDVDSLLDESGDTHVYARELAEARRRNRVDWVLNSDEAAMAPLAELAFPADWPERTARRAKYRDGVIYESRPYQGKDGKMYTTVIYNLGDLVHPVPNFYASYPGTAREQRMQNLDRQYLRERSQIFNGYPEDLAAGLPLLHFFGGIDNNAVSPRTDPRQTERIVRIIERFVNDQ
jgi:hypothetical protein